MARAVKYNWAERLIFGLHHGGIAETADHFVLALHTRVCDLTYFAAIEIGPALSIELTVECDQVLGVDEIDKGISDVALVFEVNRKVEKIILALENCKGGERLIRKAQNGHWTRSDEQRRW